MKQDIHTFLDHLAVSGRSQATLDAYGHDLKQFAEYLEDEGLDGWAGVRHQHVAAWRDEALGLGLAATSVARKIAAVRAFFTWAQGTGLVNENPALNVKRPAVRRKFQVIARAEVKRLLARHYVGGRSRVVFYLLYAGCRASELCDLDIDHLDLAEGIVHVCGREVPITWEAVEAIKAYIGGARITTARRDSRALLVSINGRRLERQSIWGAIREVALPAEGGVPINSRTLRNTGIVDYLERGFTVAEVMAITGQMDDYTVSLLNKLARKAVA
ncbi:MAG: tyrosine-type recombinase/integrase [Candidatus Sericytochromatia bacterium]